VAAAFVPERGDLVWLQFTPQRGHEQSGRRPALILSPRAYNRKVGLALACPVTGQVKGYPFEVLLPDGLAARGAILCDQVKSVDWRARKARRLDRVSPEVMSAVTARILALVDPE
jgi:mRNA interferase MazF